MSDAAQKFIKQSKLKAFDKDHRKTIQFNIGKYTESFHKGMEQYADIETNIFKVFFLHNSSIPQKTI